MTWLPRSASRLLTAAAVGFAALVAAGQASAQSLIRDTEIEGIIREWVDPVFVSMGLNPSDVEVLLVNDNELNAFATRGRIMGVNTGLILRTKNPNELLGVMAHEAGHIKNRHTQRDGAQNAAKQPMFMTMARAPWPSPQARRMRASPSWAPASISARSARSSTCRARRARPI
jgi:predicted Zn-dependent protease